MFTKYVSIENSYRNAFITKFVSHFPELEKDVKYYVLEKLDGANISLIFLPDGTVSFAKRPGLISEGENFYDFFNIVKKYSSLIEDFTEYAVALGKKVTLYGELYGSGIQKRINYGKDKYIRIFDVSINNIYEPFFDYTETLERHGVCIPILMENVSLQEALNFDVESNPNSEGVVIKPMLDEYWIGYERFILKKKHSRFTEKEKVTKDYIPLSEQFSREVNFLKSGFRSYLNTNRVLSVFSKHGKIESPSQLSEYIKLIMIDMREDFYKENKVPELDKRENKYIFNISKEIVEILNKYL